MTTAERVQRLLKFVLQEEAGTTPARSAAIASRFADLQEFLDVDLDTLREVRSITGKGIALRLSDEDLVKIEGLKKSGYLDPKQSPTDNYIQAMGRSFTRRQVLAVNSLTLARLSPNPFLVESLNLRTVDELIRLNVHMTATRSIVTSMGFFIQDLLAESSDTAHKVRSGWDLLKITDGKKKNWIQIKSGPNDMDKDQVVYWAEQFKKIDAEDAAFIGITYGKRGSTTISLNHLRQWIPNWEVRVLIGRELWEFVSEDKEYVNELFNALRKAAISILGGRTMAQEIDSCVARIVEDFKVVYGDGESGINKYLAQVF